MYCAHIREDGEEQTVREHCINTAEFTASALATIGLAQCGWIAGVLHDAGKCKDEFDDYLVAAVKGGNVARGSVNHTFAGARFLLDRWHSGEELGLSEVTAELLAFAIGSHHGLFDCIDPARNSGFFHRQTKEKIGYEASIHNFLKECVDIKTLDARFRTAVREMGPTIEKISSISTQPDDELADQETAFYMGLLARMILSAVIEGDRRDTATFLNGDTFPRWPENMRGIWSNRLKFLEDQLNIFPHERAIDVARKVISDTCAEFADNPGGIYRLNVPTGGGKTLASLRYALTHAKKWNKARVVFTSPLLSILDQNAAVIRRYVGDDSLILEHHSNLAEPEDTSERLRELELLTDTWESPVIITTLVQLLNTCFLGKTSAIRRFHSLCNSIIVIDEVQTVPEKLLTLFNLAMNFLSRVCGATIVLCSATYPELENVTHPLCQIPIDMVPYDRKLWEVFKRTEIQNAGHMRLEEMLQMISDVLEDCRSLLVVCNTKNEAAYLFSNLKIDNCDCFHLSAAMCMEHRRETLKLLQSALDGLHAGTEQRVVCISTQVIEAGVDISFQQVIRLSAGMDSIVQAAGRCNRHAEQEKPASVRVVRCIDEKLRCLEDIARGQIATTSLFNAFADDPQRFEGDLSSNQAIAFYYHKLYGDMNSEFQDDQVDEHGSVYQLLADNPRYADENCRWTQDYYLRQAFRLAGDLFQVFDENTVELVVPYGKGRMLQQAILAASQMYGQKDWKSIHEWIQQAKGYSISVYGYQFEKLQKLGAVTSLFDGEVFLLSDGFYDNHFGFSIANGISGFQEV